MQVALKRRRGQPLTADEEQLSTLEYCFDLPVHWAVEYKVLSLRFKGWAASFEEGGASVRVTFPDGRVEEHHADQPRPDVVAHFRNYDKSADERCGFDFSLSLPNEIPGSYEISIEVFNASFESGPIPFQVNDFTSMRWQQKSRDALNESSRANYKDTWNAVSQNENQAKISVAGYTDESEFERTAEYTLEVLQSRVGVKADDVVLEIGCGVGRMARILSPLCRRWIGGDVSENMLQHARQRVGDLDNVEFTVLNGWDLAPIDDASVDMVYCTVVFMHLDEWDRFNYICEAMRVLRPGGRLYVDNYNLCSLHGWDFFMKNMLENHPLDRPSNISKSSTSQELGFFFRKAGFENVSLHESDEMWLHAWGEKPR
jgi:ubiquinone/menaquinone biosynthesis C-methylase UbiE